MRYAFSPPLERITLVLLCAIALGAPRDARCDSVVGQWTELHPTGTSPPTVYAPTAILDPVRDRIVVFGGPYTPWTWILSLTDPPAWSEMSTDGTAPAGTDPFSAIYDPLRDRMLVFGGGTDQVHALSLGDPTPAWSLLSPTGTAPAPRGHHSAIYDPVGDRMIVFGGRAGYPFVYYNDVWALSLAGTPAWSEITPLGPTPAPRGEHTATYDAAHHRMVILGGAASFDSMMEDAWSLSLGGTPGWSRISGGADPPGARARHTAVYDALHHRVLVFGGAGEFSFDSFAGFWASGRDGLWGLIEDQADLWAPLPASGGPPPPRSAHLAIYDASRDRMLVFGGRSQYSDIIVNYTDLWALSWTPLEGSVIACPGWAAGIPGSTRTLAYSIEHSDVEPITYFWAVGGPAWSGLPASGSVTVYPGEIAVVHAQVGIPQNASVNESHLITFYAAPEFQSPQTCQHGIFASGRYGLTGVPPVAASRLVLLGARPNPASGPMRVWFSAAGGRRAVLELLDVNGRRRAIKTLDAPGAGMGSVTLDETRGLTPGIYLLRLTQGIETRTAKAVLLH